MVDLKGYSVLVDNEEQARELQEIAFEQGFEWRFGYKKIQHLDERSFQFGLEGVKVITFDCGKDHYQDEHITKKAHFNDLFKVEFVPTAMRCTQEQFEAIKPKLKGLNVGKISSFSYCDYLVNNLGGGERKLISNAMSHAKTDHNRTAYEEWDEELFLKNCGIVEPMENKGEQLKKEAKKRGYTHDNFKCLINEELDGSENIDEWYYEECGDTLYTMPEGEGGNVVYENGVWAEIVPDYLEQRLEISKTEAERLEKELEKAKLEVERLKSLIEEENKPKVGDWVKSGDSKFFKVESWMTPSPKWVKIHNKHLIEMLDES